MNYWGQKKQTAGRDKDALDKRLDALTDLKSFKANLQECEKQAKVKQNELASVKKMYNQAKD